MVPLSNVRFDVMRTRAPSGNTSAHVPVPHLQGVTGSVDEIDSADAPLLGRVGFAEYKIDVEASVDIATGDSVTNMVHIASGTPWPSDAPRHVWRVVSQRESAPGFLAHRVVYIAR